MADPPLPLPLRQLLQLPRPLRLLPPPVFQQLRLIQILRLVRLAWSRGRDEPPGPHAPCVRRGGVNEYSHL